MCGTEHWLDCIASFCSVSPLTKAVASKTVMPATDAGFSYLLCLLSVSGSGGLLRAHPFTQHLQHLIDAQVPLFWNGRPQAEMSMFSEGLCIQTLSSSLLGSHNYVVFSPSITQFACWCNYLVMWLTPWPQHDQKGVAHASWNVPLCPGQYLGPVCIRETMEFREPWFPGVEAHWDSQQKGVGGCLRFMTSRWPTSIAWAA